MRRMGIALISHLFGRCRAGSTANSAAGPASNSAGARRPHAVVVAFEKELGTGMAATPLFSALRRARPDMTVTLAGSALMAEIAAGNPYVDRIHILPSPYRTPLRSVIAARRAVPADAGSYDWLITTVAARRYALGLVAAAIPARRRSGFGAAEALALYDAPLTYDWSISTQANNLRALRPLGITLPEEPGHGPEPEIYFTPDLPGTVDGLLRAEGIDPSRPIAVLAPQTSGGQPTDWFPDRFAELADLLAERRGLQPVFVGTAAGAELIDGIRGRMRGPAASLAGRTGIAALGALFAGADLAVCLDSGAMHVARATRVPLVVVASGWEAPHHWLPLGVPTCRIVSAAGDWCGGCAEGHCPDRSCMKRIAPADVLAAADGLLLTFPPAAAARAARIAACTGTPTS